MLDLSASATDIMAIPLSKPHLLFPGDADQASLRHKKLVAKWHPDRNKGGADVMTHINVLFEKAIEQIRSGAWAGGSKIRIRSMAGKTFQFDFIRSDVFELGRVYVGSRLLLYMLDKPYRDLAASAVSMIQGLSYQSPSMRAEHERYMPKIHMSFPMMDGRSAVIIKKEPDQHCLADIQAHLGGSIEPKHVAWMLSSLYNINCYLRWAGINHNDISPANYYVSASQHNGALLGGWWYSAKAGSKPRAVPARTHRVGRDFTSKAIDGSLIRVTGQELLGTLISSAPTAMQLWLKGLGMQDSYKEYEGWSEVLKQSFGARRYAELKLPSII